MNFNKAIPIAMLSGLLALTACTKSSDSPSAAAAAAPTTTPTPAAEAAAADAGPKLSDDAQVTDLTIKRLQLTSTTMEVLDPVPKGVRSSGASSVLTIALCGARITNADIPGLSQYAHPITITEGSQTVIQRDPTYRFGDGTTAAGHPPYALLTCGKDDATKPAILDAALATSEVLVRNLEVGAIAMEVFDPAPKGAGRAKRGQLVMIMCGPRITDKNLSDVVGIPTPIAMSRGSQLVLRRDKNYTFGTGERASSAAVVVVTCN